MTDLIRIGLIGCGAMGQAHLAVWEKTKGAHVNAVCDFSPVAAQNTGAKIGAVGFSQLEDMLKSGLVDAVDICTPSGLHADQAMMAAYHGIHVLCEKPLDLNIDKIDRLIDECDSRNLTLACLFQRRTYEGAKKVAATIAAGGMGDILSCSAYVKWWRSSEYYASSSWRGTWALDGGVLANQAIHALDLMCWLAGEVETVEYAHLATIAHEMEAEDYASAILRFKNGARGVVEATTCCSPDLCTRVEIYGTRGAACFDDAVVVKYGIDGEDRLNEVEDNAELSGGRSHPMDISMRGHEILFADFVNSIITGTKPIVDGRDARVSADAMSKIYKKANPALKLGI